MHFWICNFQFQKLFKDLLFYSEDIFAWRNRPRLGLGWRTIDVKENSLKGYLRNMVNISPLVNILEKCLVMCSFDSIMHTLNYSSRHWQ